MKTNATRIYANLLLSYIWLAIFTTIYFVLVDVLVRLSPDFLCLLFILGTFVFFTILITAGTKTYKSLSKFDKLYLEQYDTETKNISNNLHLPRKSGHATETVFYRIYEVVAALSIYEASRGVIFSVLAPNTEITPLSALYHEPGVFMLFLFFIIISIQFIVGVSKHFESYFSSTGHLNVYAIVNYVLILGNAISLLSMGISVSVGNFALFSLWFIALLVVDYIWILLFKVLRIGIFGFKDALGLEVTRIDSFFRDDAKIYQVVNRYWMSGNIAFIIYLSIMEPIAEGYITPQKDFFYVYLVLLLIGVFISTFVNSKCLSELDKIETRED
jgi:hypothetical protein